MSTAPNAPAALRNRDPILQVLRSELRGTQRVLEIGSGTGQHAVHFAAALPGLTWQTSDLAENHTAIRYWIAESGLSNVLQPLLLNVSEPGDAQGQYSAVYSANTAHIMSEVQVANMLLHVACSLQPRGKFFLYGPFRVNGQFSGDGNQRFDQSLKAQNPLMGIRDLEWIDRLALEQGLQHEKSYAMPANNLLLIWQLRNGEKVDDAT
jgi:cyclopropane fatty-acyl-phospholipid synthase-like methyltransferase